MVKYDLEAKSGSWPTHGVTFLLWVDRLMLRYVRCSTAAVRSSENTETWQGAMVNSF